MLNITGLAVLHFNSVPLGESPPSPPRAFFGYDGLIEKVVELTETLKPTALIGTGGIGKTSIALTVLHHDRVKQRFGENRRFIRCDQFPPSRPNFLAQLSKAIGAGVGNPEDMKLLRPFLLSSKRMLIVLDNAESILDPQGTNAQEIYSVVDELCRFRTVCLFITSRITTLPRRCVRLKIFALSMKAACDIFYSIYHGSIGRSGIINGLLRRMDRHPLSVTLLATAAACNAWDYDQLTKEWDTQWARVSEIGCNKCLATTIELTLASPKFCSLGPNARDLLGVVAFFPQGINKTNIDRFFPTISNRIDIFATLCVLSLVYQSNGFFTMLAPIRDYLYPQDPQSSPLLCAVRDNYFSRLSVSGDPDQPGFKEARWVVSESANVEHLLDVSTSVNQNGGDIWDACYHFLRHLYWHKPWQIPLRSKIEALPDDHPSKPKCLSGLSQLFGRVGNHAEQIRVLTHALELERRSGNDHRVAQTLQHISDVNRLLGLSEEGIEQANESLEILERIGDTKGQTQCLNQLAWLLFDNKQLDAAENAASRAMDLTVGNGQEYLVCQLHQVLCKIHNSKGREKEVVHHLEAALNIASPPKWRDELFWICYSLAEWSGNEEKLDAANKCIKRAKSHAVDDPYRQGRAMVMQANIWCLQLRLEDAKSETLRALEIYKKSGAAYDAGVCRDLLQMIERAMEIHPMGFQGELPEAMLYPADFYFLPRNTPGFSTPVMITQGAVHGPGGYPIPEYYDPHPFF